MHTHSLELVPLYLCIPPGKKRELFPLYSVGALVPGRVLHYFNCTLMLKQEFDFSFIGYLTCKYIIIQSPQISYETTLILCYPGTCTEPYGTFTETYMVR